MTYQLLELELLLGNYFLENLSQSLKTTQVRAPAAAQTTRGPADLGGRETPLDNGAREALCGGRACPEHEGGGGMLVKWNAG